MYPIFNKISFNRNRGIKYTYFKLKGYDKYINNYDNYMKGYYKKYVTGYDQYIKHLWQMYSGLPRKNIYGYDEYIYGCARKSI